LEKRFTCKELDCFFEVGDENDLKGDTLADETTGDEFILFWKVMV